MNRHFDTKFNRELLTIYPGEYASSFGPEYIATILGSCVAIALYDPQHMIGGMNHFILAKDTTLSDEDKGLVGRFGEYAVELLINDMLKKGAVRENFIAKVFGGSNVFNVTSPRTVQVGEANIKFAFDYLEKEHIPVVASDIGGIEPRKIIFDPVTSKVWLKRIKNSNASQEIITQENDYLASVRKQKSSAGDIIWFDKK